MLGDDSDTGASKQWELSTKRTSNAATFSSHSWQRGMASCFDDNIDSRHRATIVAAAERFLEFNRWIADSTPPTSRGFATHSVRIWNGLLLQDASGLAGQTKRSVGNCQLPPYEFQSRAPCPYSQELCLMATRLQSRGSCEGTRSPFEKTWRLAILERKWKISCRFRVASLPRLCSPRIDDERCVAPSLDSSNGRCLLQKQIVRELLGIKL